MFTVIVKLLLYFPHIINIITRRCTAACPFVKLSPGAGGVASDLTGIRGPPSPHIHLTVQPLSLYPYTSFSVSVSLCPWGPPINILQAFVLLQQVPC